MSFLEDLVNSVSFAGDVEVMPAPADLDDGNDDDDDEELAEDAWNESDHPRGQPGNAGQFGKGGGGGSAGPTKSVPAALKGKPILAGYRDADGYEKHIENGGAPVGSTLKRHGQGYITSPEGETVKAGFWMNWPEEEWNISDEAWQAMSLEDRAAMEVKQQATAYAPLREQFENAKKANESPFWKEQYAKEVSGPAAQTSPAFAEFAQSVHKGKPLKQDHGRHFKTDGTHEVKLSDLKLSKPISKTDAQLAQRQLKIAGAAGGQNAYKRAPVLVTVDADGQKTVKVGHDVVAAAKANGWDSVPVIAIQQADTRDTLTRDARGAIKQLDSWLDEGNGLVTSEGGRFVNTPPDATSEKEYARPGPMLFVAGVKSMGPGSRGEQKVRDDYFGHWDRLKDAARCTVAVDTLDEVHAMLDKMKASGMVVAQPIKDRYKGKPTDEGYRDINMVVRMPNGHLAEVQVNTKTMLMAKNEAHKHYEVARVIAAKYMRSKLPVARWPAEDRAAFEKASAAQKSIYEEAYAGLAA